jgi:hypothetical protein
MPYYYASGEEILAGDKVVYAGQECAVEFVADPLTDPTSWYVTEHGGGVMLTAFGNVFIDPSEEEDLEFISRKASGL